MASEEAGAGNQKAQEGIGNRILTKLTSGRYILTIIAGATFAYAVVKGILPAEAVAAIVTMVFVEYFQRHDRKNEVQ